MSEREIWIIEPSHTQLEFSAKHMMITNVRGRFNQFEGRIEFDPNNIENSTVEGAVYTHSVDTNQGQRDDHLRSPDFFHAEVHPTMTFKSTKVEHVRGDEYKVTGDLTIRGTTKPVTFKGVDEGGGTKPWGGQRWGLSADTKGNRKDWNLNWNAALETGGWLVGDDIKISAEVQAMPLAEYEAAQARAAQAAAA